LFVISNLLPIFIIGQTTSEVVVMFYNTQQSKEEYTVLKSDEKTKHGQYVRYYKSPEKLTHKKFIKEKGNYLNGKKDGEWMYFSYPKQKRQGEIIRKEIYTNGLKTGIWETHHYESNDHIIEKFNYDLNIKIEPEIIIELKYPRLAFENLTQGEVVIKFRQNPDCSLTDFKIIKSLSSECDSEALRRFRRIGELQKKYNIENCIEKEFEVSVEFKLD